MIAIVQSRAIIKAHTVGLFNLRGSMKEKIVVSISGGQTSAFMAIWLKENFSDRYEFVYIFANTGREHEETLMFLDRVDRHWNLGVIWLEGVASADHGVGMRHKVVTFQTASRKGEPFEQFISVEGIPNISRQKCSDYLKTQTIRHYMRTHGLCGRGWSVSTAIGMRADEPKRADPTKAAAKRYRLVYPLAHWGSFDKQDVNDFWDEQPFKLNIPPHYGNCLTCFKKSNAKLYLIAHEHPEWFSFNKEMESKYGMVKAISGHSWFRGNRSTDQLMDDACLEDRERLIYLSKTPDDGPDCCGESCEPFQNITGEIE